MVWNEDIQRQPGSPRLILMKVLALFVFLACFVVVPDERAVCNASESDGVVIAEGNGFRLTEADVVKVKAYYDKTPIRTTEAEYVQVAFKLKIFAHDAMVRQLDKELEIPPEEIDTAESWVKLANVCYNKNMEEYAVSELAIESYYRAFPERFKGTEQSDSGFDQKALDPETRNKVRYVIINAKNASVILSEAVDLLKIKYSIRFAGKTREE